MKYVVLRCRTIKILISKWPRSRKFGQLLQAGRTVAFHVAAFRLSMIAPIKKFVNHSRTAASMRETGWDHQKQEVRLRSGSTVWSEFGFGSVGHCFLCCNQFFSAVLWSLRFPFLLVLRLSLHAVYYAKKETNEHWLQTDIVIRCPTFWLTSPLWMQALKLCFCLEDPQD